MNTIALVFFLSEVILLIFKRAGKKQTDNRDRNSMALLWTIILVSIALAVSYTIMFPTAIPGKFLKLAATATLIVGTVIRWTAIYQLKNAFTVDVAISKDQKLKSDGLYRYLRHPSYTGLLLDFFGLSLFLNSAIAVVIIMIPVFLGLIYRVGIEEKALMEAFGKEYEAHCARTKRFIPFIY